MHLRLQSLLLALTLAACGGSDGPTGAGDPSSSAGAPADVASAGASDAAGPGIAPGDGWTPGHDRGCPTPAFPGCSESPAPASPDSGATVDPNAPPDRDRDDIPDYADVFPDDPFRPGQGFADLVYAHTDTQLYTLHMKTFELKRVGAFGWPDDGGDHKMTDIAIDRYGVLYGVTFDKLYVCHPASMQCDTLATLPRNLLFNALSMVPRGTLDPELDVLVSATKNGDYYRILPLPGGTADVEKIGSYGDPYGSAGDIYAIEDDRTFAAVYKNDGAFLNLDETFLIEIDPITGAAQREVARIEGYTDIFGLAGRKRQSYAFDEGGDIIVLDNDSGEVIEVIRDTDHRWWGAGVRTLLRDD